MVTIDRNRNYYVGNDVVNIHLLGKTVLNRLKGSETQPVYIRCEENVKFGDFVQVVDALEAGEPDQSEHRDRAAGNGRKQFVSRKPAARRVDWNRQALFPGRMTQ